ncbi:uncharacterized protein LOC111341700 [Stylophora pistillata]|uniref:uncharacterized protein LOC111341700 n=1 Tax=Stylophora pistillata TaxID=50429 RepID=UPI000C044EE7|nr:uncharacterized protein LOC111341700 [Stylophora pistillata]
MLPRRCVVQDCDRVADKQLGISVHTSPGTGTERAMWKRFVSQHRKHFKPKGTFGICSLHFTNDCFTRSVHIKGTERRLKPGSVTSIWKKGSVSLSERTRRRITPCESCRAMKAELTQLKAKMTRFKIKLSSNQEQ